MFHNNLTTVNLFLFNCRNRPLLLLFYSLHVVLGPWPLPSQHVTQLDRIDPTSALTVQVLPENLPPAEEQQLDVADVPGPPHWQVVAWGYVLGGFLLFFGVVGGERGRT